MDELLQNGADVKAINASYMRLVGRDKVLEVEVEKYDRMDIGLCLDAVVIHEDMCNGSGSMKVPTPEGRIESTSNYQVGWRGILSVHKTEEF